LRRWSASGAIEVATVIEYHLQAITIFRRNNILVDFPQHLKHATFTKGNLLKHGRPDPDPSFPRASNSSKQAGLLTDSQPAQLPPQLNFTRNIPHHTTNNQTTNRFPLNYTTKPKLPTSRTNPPKHTTNHAHKPRRNGPSQGIPRDAARVRQGRPPVHHQVQQAYASSVPDFPLSFSLEIERLWTFADMLCSRQARVPAHLASRRHGFLDHGCYWLHCQAE
jgi:hypothetical protein